MKRTEIKIFADNNLTQRLYKIYNIFLQLIFFFDDFVTTFLFFKVSMKTPEMSLNSGRCGGNVSHAVVHRR